MPYAVAETRQDSRYMMLDEFEDPNGILPVTVDEQRKGGVKNYERRTIYAGQFLFKLVPITVDMYHRMREEGILPSREHIELLNGVMFWVDRRGPEGYGKPSETVALTPKQYDRMLEVGILQERAPIELIEGFMVWKDRSAEGEDFMTIGDKHRTCTALLQRLTLLVERVGATLFMQVPMLLPDNSEPEPDGYIARGTIRRYLKRKPDRNDVTCVIEVSQSSLVVDRGRKLRNYAKAGIPQYLVINVNGEFVDVFENPVSSGQYTKETRLRKHQSVLLRIGAKATIKVRVKSLLP